MSNPAAPVYDYIVIGSGAAGGTIASRLAETGKRVVVLECGFDPLHSVHNKTVADYRVPVFHAMASENRDLSWPYFVSHFDETARARCDVNWCDRGIFYPRAAAVGGCTAHNAMIFLLPPDNEWNALAQATGDLGWSAAAMRRHRRSLEACRHRPIYRLLAALGYDPTGHGWNGWLHIERAMPVNAFSDVQLMRMLARIALADLGRNLTWTEWLKLLLTDWGDPNDVRRHGAEQLCYLPLATRRHARMGTRDRLRCVAEKHPGTLCLWTNTLAIELLFDGKRVAGVRWERGREGHRERGPPPDSAGEVFAAREVILSAGAFETPKLLMLSGIGDPAALMRLGISVRAALPEVGRNLQDRYEIGVVHRTTRPWASLRGAKFSVADRLYRQWRWLRRGMYTSNGGAIAALRRSRNAEGQDPDLVLMGLLGRFSGYRVGYADQTWPGLDGFTWAVLKGKTSNRAGSVTLNTKNPRASPEINFRNFSEGGEADLDALVEGVEMARTLCAPLKERGLIATEEIPGPALVGAALRDWVKDNAWGHHACGTVAIGPVLDPQCRVLGVPGLRVVDASIFPRIPGLFITAPIMLAAEKVAVDIIGR